MASSGLAFLLLLASAWEKHLPLAPGRRLGVAVRLSRATYTSRPGSPLATDAGRRRRLVLIATVAEPPAADSGEAWDAGELPGVRDGPDASVSLVTPPRPPATEAAGDGGDGTGVDLPLLWAMVEPHTGHLGEEDRANLKLGLRVLISKVAIVCGADRDRSVHPPPAPLIEPSFRTPVSRQVEVAGDAAALGGGGEAGVSGGRDAPTSGDAVRAAAAAAVAAAAVAVAATAAAEAAQGKTIPPAAPDQMAAAAAPAAASGAGADAESPGLAASAARALVMLSAVRTGQDMLRLGLDAETVAAAMLSETAFTREAPTWPCAQPTAFTLRVDHLIEQVRRRSQGGGGIHSGVGGSFIEQGRELWARKGSGCCLTCVEGVLERVWAILAGSVGAALPLRTPLPYLHTPTPLPSPPPPGPPSCLHPPGPARAAYPSPAGRLDCRSRPRHHDRRRRIGAPRAAGGCGGAAAQAALHRPGSAGTRRRSAGRCRTHRPS
jgi:hypothetical protein